MSRRAVLTPKGTCVDESASIEPSGMFLQYVIQLGVNERIKYSFVRGGASVQSVVKVTN